MKLNQFQKWLLCYAKALFAFSFATKFIQYHIPTKNRMFGIEFATISLTQFD